VEHASILKRELVAKQMRLYLRFRFWISLHERSNEKMPDPFCISFTLATFVVNIVAAVVPFVRSGESMQNGTASFGICTEQSIISVPSSTACRYARSEAPGKMPVAPLWVMISGFWEEEEGCP
jgi:hypothetical protein